MPKDYHGIEAQRSARRHEAGRERTHGEEQGDGGERQRVPGAHLVENAAEHASQADGREAACVIRPPRTGFAAWPRMRRRVSVGWAPIAARIAISRERRLTV